MSKNLPRPSKRKDGAMLVVHEIVDLDGVKLDAKRYDNGVVTLKLLEAAPMVMEQAYLPGFGKDVIVVLRPAQQPVSEP